MWRRRFWLDAAERAVKTAAQTAASFLAVGTVVGINWAALGATVAGAALLSICTSVGSATVTGSGTASAVSVPLPVTPARNEA